MNSALVNHLAAALLATSLPGTTGGDSPQGRTARLYTIESRESLAAFAFGDNRHVAVGPSGTILVSLDGRHWNRVDQVTSENLRDVTFGNRMFVAVGSCGIVVRSPDGRQWTVQSNHNFPCLKAIVYGNGTFVAVGTEGTIITSKDGFKWTGRRLGTGSFQDVNFLQTRFFAVGDRGTIAISDDGSLWRTTVVAPNVYFRSVVDEGDRFVVRGGGQSCYSSRDGFQWEATN